MNAIVPSSSFTSKFVGGGNDQHSVMKRGGKSGPAQNFRNKQRKAEAIVLEHKKDMLEVRNLLNERQEKIIKLG